MALRSSRASFNFLTSLIEYEGAWTDRDVCGVPYVEAEPERPGSFGSVLSTILHELTHLASFRTTRLGWVTHAAASRLLKQWRHGETPVFAGTTAKIIGTMVPILEGLATYAQLDLDGDDTLTVDHDELSMASWFNREDIPDEGDNISLTKEMMMAFKHGKA